MCTLYKLYNVNIINYVGENLNQPITIITSWLLIVFVVIIINV